MKLTMTLKNLKLKASSPSASPDRVEIIQALGQTAYFRAGHSLFTGSWPSAHFLASLSSFSFFLFWSRNKAAPSTCEHVMGLTRTWYLLCLEAWYIIFMTVSDAIVGIINRAITSDELVNAHT